MSAGSCAARDDFRAFLKTIDLNKYRNLFKDKKYVEQDLPNDVVRGTLESMYEHYWIKRKFLSFDDWFNDTWNKVIKLRGFNDFLWQYWHMKLGKDKEWDEWFKEGFKARLYRTWTALLTQLDFTYTIACVLEEKNLKVTISASPELNMKGIDVRLCIKGKEDCINFQVYKVSERKEARGKTRSGVISIPYPVISRAILIRRIKNPHTKKKEDYEIMLRIFDKYYEELKNGFIVFKKELAEEILERVLSGKSVEEFTVELAKCLIGKECKLLS
jgi:hypothetical protein